MPDYRQTGDKPMRPQDNLGADVQIESEAIANDTWAQTLLKDLGAYFKNVDKEGDTEYMGTFCTHIYKSKDLQTSNGQYGVAMVNQFTFGSDQVNEYIAMMALSNLGVEMRKRYGRAHHTTDTKDKRGQGN